MVEVNNEYKIIGLHNAYHAVLSRMFFSAVTSVDFSYSSNSMESAVSVDTQEELPEEHETMTKEPEEQRITDEDNPKEEVASVRVTSEPIGETPRGEDSVEIGCIDYYTRQKLNEPHETSKFEKVSDLNVVGYSPSMHMHSHPKHKKVFLSAAGTPEECPSLPSCTDMSRVLDSSNLVKDRFDKPSPPLSNMP